VCVSMPIWASYVVRYAVEQRVFLYELYVKCGSPRKCRGNFVVSFQGTQFQEQEASINVLESHVRWATTGQTCYKLPYAYLKKIDEIRAWLELTLQKSPRRLAQGTGLEIVNPHFIHEMKFNLRYLNSKL
jgi:hypothetical protein